MERKAVLIVLPLFFFVFVVFLQNASMAASGRQVFGNVAPERLNAQFQPAQVGRKSLGPSAAVGAVNRTSLAPSVGLPRGPAPNPSTAANDRRQTLAAPKPGRKSIGPSGVAGRASMSNNAANRTSLAPSNRLSMAPSGRPSVSGAGGRLSMAPGGSSSSTLKVDPRPIKDKSYVNYCLTNLLDFLLSNGYDRPISIANLSSPSQQEFKHIVEFLFSRIDPSFKLTNLDSKDAKDPKEAKKAEDEIPVLFRSLRYPFQISSRSLQSVGTAHTWPALLAALHWIVELINYNINASAIREEQQQLEEQQLISAGASASISSNGNGHSSMDRMFFQFVTEAYLLFLEDGADIPNKTEENFILLNQSRNQEIANATRDVIEKTHEVRSEIDKLENSDTRVSKLRAMVSQLRKDEESFKSYLSGLDNHRSGLETAMREKTTDLSKYKSELIELEKENQRLEATLTKQRSEGLDIDRMNQEKSSLEEGLAKEKIVREELEQAVNETEMELSKEFEIAEQSISMFNSFIRQQGLVRQPGDLDDAAAADSEYFFDAELRLNPYGQEMLSQNMKTSVKPQLRRILQRQRELQGDYLEQLFTLREQRDQLSETLHSERAQLAELTQQASQLEATYARTRDTFEESQRMVENQLSRELDSSAKRRDECRGRLHMVETQKAGMERQRDEHREKVSREMGQMTTTIMSAVDLVANYKQAVNDKLSELVGFAKSKKLELDQLSAQQQQAHLHLPRSK
jgi:kinetochore protein NDC80